MKRQILIIVVFCLLLAGLTIWSVIKPDSTFSETENRVLAQKPLVTVDTVFSGEFEAGYEEYLTDQFPCRDSWVGAKTSIERLLFKQESKDIYFGKDGYLIEKHTGAFSTEQAEKNIQELSEFVRSYKDQVQISVIVAPTAVEILRDKLPPLAPDSEQGGYLTELQSSLPQDVWLDVSGILREHQGEDIFYKTDHHWTTLAAFYAYQAWERQRGMGEPQLSDYAIQTVTDSFEGTIQSKLGIKTQMDSIELFLPHEEVSVTVTVGDSETPLYDFSALESKDKYAVFLGGNQPVINIKTSAGTGKKLLVIKDSYANCFIPFVVADFDKIDVVDLRYTKQRLSEMLADGDYSDVLVLYNAAGFVGDRDLVKINQ